MQRVKLLAATVLLAVCYIFPQVDCSSDCNQFDRYHDFVCPNGHSISRVWGWHHNGKEDRIYCYSCQNNGATGSSCYTTGYVNSYDYPVAVQCNPNYYFAGVRSVHDNRREDRRFDFRCCKSNGKCTRECRLVGPVNHFDGHMDYRLQGKVIIGAFSWHDNGKEDRQWWYQHCKLQDC